MAKQLTAKEKLKQKLEEQRKRLEEEFKQKKSEKSKQEKKQSKEKISPKKKASSPEDSRKKNLAQILSSIEESIQELCRIFAESEDSKHLGIRGLSKLTPKQQMIINQLDFANKRFERILKMFEKSRI